MVVGKSREIDNTDKPPEPKDLNFSYRQQEISKSSIGKSSIVKS